MKPGLTRTEILLLLLVFLTRASQALDSERSGTVPFIFDDNRVFAQLDFVRADGTLRKVLAFVDLGTPALVLDKKLYEELQVGQGKPVILRVGQSNRGQSTNLDRIRQIRRSAHCQRLASQDMLTDPYQLTLPWQDPSTASVPSQARRPL